MNLRNISLRERKHAETKIALLKILQGKLVKRQFDEIPVKELCEEVLISDVTFFNYFPSKNDLLIYYIQIWSLEMSYKTKKHLIDKGALKEIEYIFDNAAEVTEKVPNLMSEIIAFITRNFNTIRFGKISNAEKIIAFPDLPEIEKFEPVNLNDLFSDRIKRAIELKELPTNTDIEILTFSLISIFFGVPIGWTKLDPARIKNLYRYNLDLILKGIK
jgi:AcrR family transcriptional regulator